MLPAPDKRPHLALPKSDELVGIRVCRHPSEWEAADRQLPPRTGNGGEKSGYITSSKAWFILVVSQVETVEFS